MAEEKNKILIIEDEPDMVMLLRIRLERENFLVLSAWDGREGLRLAEGERPSIIILDLVLPGLDGFRLCGMLKEGSGTKNIPVIILSARADEQDLRRGVSAGAAAYITKPFDWKELRREIERLAA